MNPDGPTNEQRRVLGNELEKLRKSYADRLPERVGEVATAWRNAVGGRWDLDEAGELRRIVHRLVGTAGSLGFLDISAEARNLEALLAAICELEGTPSEEESEQVSALIVGLEERAARPSLTDLGVAPAGGQARPDEERSLLVYLVEDDEVLAQEISIQLEHFGYTVRSFHSPGSVLAASQAEQPFAILMDIVFPEGDLAGVEAIRRLRTRISQDVQVIFVSVRSDIEARLEAVRAGCSAYFTKPVNIPSLVESLDQLASRRATTYRVLVVDDDPAVAAFYGHALRAAGIEVKEVNDPLGVPSLLVEFQPDLILMDVYMDGCTGVELAAVIRQEETFAGLPIVFLSSERDRMRQISAIDRGGDDFFTKPIDPEHLVAAVAARAKRGRVLRSLMERDGLTGLLSHSRIVEQLEIAARSAIRRQGRLALAMTDIDSFKEVNDRHGHLAGDQVLKSLAYLLKQRLRLSDVIGRFGGDECLVILPDTDGPGAAHTFSEICTSFAAVRHSTGAETFSVTVSCGIAELQPGGTAHELIHAADSALYRAKRAGRNRVVLAGA